jgi:hypothetical protein
MRGMFCALRAAFALREESKVVSSHLRMFHRGRVVRNFFVGLLAGFLLVPVCLAQTAPFTLTPSGGLSPAAVDAGQTATAVIDLTGDSSVGSVALSCTVTSNVSTTSMPTCQISPNSATPPATPSLTVTTLGATPAGEYSFTVVGTANGTTEQSTPLLLNVVEATQSYALTVTQSLNPGTVSPGGTAQAIVTITPLAGYSGTVTLSCLSITPAVVASPYCSFLSNTTPPENSITVESGTPATATMTISTYGTQQTTAELISPRIFSGFWFGVPGVVLVGLGIRRRKNKFFACFGALMLMALSLLVPACGGITATSNNNYGYTTPKNTYSITITGVDENGVSPGQTGTAATVSLTVN